MDYAKGMRMARLLKSEDSRIRDAIYQVQEAQHGVVALKFSEDGRQMEIEILDEPYLDEVRVYPG